MFVVAKIFLDSIGNGRLCLRCAFKILTHAMRKRFAQASSFPRWRRMHGRWALTAALSTSLCGLFRFPRRQLFQSCLANLRVRVYVLSVCCTHMNSVSVLVNCDRSLAHSRVRQTWLSHDYRIYGVLGMFTILLVHVLVQSISLSPMPILSIFSLCNAMIQLLEFWNVHVRV